MNGDLRLLAIFPHPDDETLGVGSTLARYAAEGVQVHLICATRGERGWSESSGPNPGMAGIARIREGELQCAARHLGLHEVRFLEYVDGELDQAAPGEILPEIASQVRRIRPQVVITYGPEGIYGHPDHIALSQYTAGALVMAADAAYEDGQPAWRASKFYYAVDSVEVVETLNDAFGGIGMQIDGVDRRHVGWQDWQITTRLDNHRYMERVREAIHCHKSQLPGFGPMPDWSVEQLSKIFGSGTFYRAYSLVNSGRAVEKDLFEGLR